MRTILVALAVMALVLVIGAVSAASAAGPTMAKRSVTPPTHNYWLSDGLNRLVFWQPPVSPRSERPAR